MSGQSCTYTSGGTTVAAYCQDGCCTDGCCSTSTSDSSTIAIIIACVVGGLILLLLIALCVWCALRYMGDDDDKKKLTDKDKKDANKMEKGNKKNNKPFTTGTNTYLGNYKKKKTYKKETDCSSDGLNKNTQTINHRGQPGDTILYSRKFFNAGTPGYKYDAYLRSDKTAEVGVCTDHRDVPKWDRKAKRRWNSTANYYTRRDSLKGSSEDDDNLETFKSGEGRAREVLTVNAYGYAAKDTGAKTDYVLKEDEKTKATIEAWQSVQPKWQPHRKGHKEPTPQQQTRAQKKWKDSLVFMHNRTGSNAVTPSINGTSTETPLPFTPPASHKSSENNANATANATDTAPKASSATTTKSTATSNKPANNINSSQNNKNSIYNNLNKKI